MTFTINGKREFVPCDQGLVHVKKDVPGRKVTLTVKSTTESDYMWKKTDPFAQVNSTCACSDCLNCARSCSDCLALTVLTRLGVPKCLYGEKLARVGRGPYHHKRETRLGGSLFQLSQRSVSTVNDSPRFGRKCIKSWLVQNRRVGGALCCGPFIVSW